MLISYIIRGQVLLLSSIAVLFGMVSSTTYGANHEDKHSLEQSQKELSIAAITTQLELMKSRLENLSTKIEWLETKLSLSKNLIATYQSDLQDNEYTAKNACLTSQLIVEKFELLKQTQEKLSANLSDLKSNTLNLSTLNELIKENFMNFLNKNQHKELGIYSSNDLTGNELNRVYLPSSCAEATIPNDFRDDTYLIHVPTSNLQPFYAYCLHENFKLKAWTIILRREDGSENFNRNWSAYKNGFGNVYGEYWIGLERLHAMTTAEPHELWVFIREFNDTTRYAKYTNFSIASESEGYKLYVDGYVGDAGDSLMKHNTMKFSTYDRVNNLGKLNCARSFKGGWWYSDCYFCNLNGVYYDLPNKQTGGGINWNGWLGPGISLKYATMAIRPAQLVLN